MSDATPGIAPSDQYQIGDEVIYIPAGVRCEITGYVWRDKIGGPPPYILMYRLSCGIDALPEWIQRDRETTKNT